MLNTPEEDPNTSALTYPTDLMADSNNINYHGAPLAVYQSNLQNLSSINQELQGRSISNELGASNFSNGHEVTQSIISSHSPILDQYRPRDFSRYSNNALYFSANLKDSGS
jgi:hypothetical protein